jgi:site-specific recombinase XerC
MIEAFLDHLRVERRLAPHTLESYGRDLAALAKYAAGLGVPPDALDRRALEQFVRQQITRGLSTRILPVPRSGPPSGEQSRR